MARKIVNDKILKDVILKELKDGNPSSTNELINLVQSKTSFTVEQITWELLELETAGKIVFNQGKQALPKSYKAYIFSKATAWYWLSIAFIVSTATIVLLLPSQSVLGNVRALLGVIFTIFMPGYSLVRAFFPCGLPVKQSNELDVLQRVTLSFGISLALIPIVALILNYTPSGIQLTPVTLTLLFITIIFATVATFREFQAANHCVG